MLITAFAGSTSSTSINKKLVVAAVTILQRHRPSDEQRVLDLRDFAMPIFSEDEERNNGAPEAAKRLLAHISAANALIISFAEHNGSYTAAYKNAFDWMSRLSKRVYDGKRIIALSTSPGPGGAASVLKAFVASAPYFGAEIVGSLSVPSFHTAYDAHTSSLRAEWQDKLASLIALL